MNHFMLSHQRYSRTLPYTESEAGRYGVHAMELLVNGMLENGASRSRLRAKVFGGAVINTHSSDKFDCVGDVNCRFVREYLATENISVDAVSLGGNFGRKIVFIPAEWGVLVKKLNHGDRIKNQEHEHWRREIARNDSLSAVDLWLSDK